MYRVSILCQSRLFLLPLGLRILYDGYFVSILCQSRLFLLQSTPSADGAPANLYPSSVNRGYFSYPRASPPPGRRRLSIHPLSIEAISPTMRCMLCIVRDTVVSILCQSRLFLLQVFAQSEPSDAECIHPLSIEAISPTPAASLAASSGSKYPSSVNRGYFSYLPNIQTT